MSEEQEVKKPDIDEDKLQNALEFLDDLRETGETNMFGAPPFVQDLWAEEYGEDLDRYKARDIVVYWMKTFSTRHAKA